MRAILSLLFSKKISTICLLLLGFYLAGQGRKPVFYETDGQWADSVLHNMTLDEKIGQLFMVAAYSNKNKDHEQYILSLIRKHHIGGLIFMQGGPYRQARLTNTYQKSSKTPLLIAMDAEWGLDMRLDSTFAFPWALTMGAVQNEKVIRDIGREMARQCKRLGVHVSFSPVVDINTNPDNPIINARSFGEDRENVLRKGRALMQGLQMENVLACAKHFPGHGDTDEDSHLTLPKLSHQRARLDSIELYPFKYLAQEGLGSMMMAHLHVPALEERRIPTSLSHGVVTELLQQEIGFEGLIFTDALNMKGVTSLFPPGQADMNALLAGNDILLFPENVERAVGMIKKAVLDNTFPQAELDRRVRKILLSKEWVGLNRAKEISTKNLHKDLHSPEARILHRMVFEEGVTLLANRQNVIPIREINEQKIALVTAGTEIGIDFIKDLRHYTRVDVYPYIAGKEMDLMEKLADYDQVIVGLYTSNKNPWKSYTYSPQIKNLVHLISLQNEFILTIFGNPYGLKNFPQAEKASALLMAYQNHPNAESMAAQIIFGAVSAKGRLPVTPGLAWPVNLGLRSRDLQRIRYGLPEEVNFDSDKLYRIDRLAQKAIDEGAIPGCQILVARHGKVVYEKAFGHHTYDKKRPVNLFDIYDIASITKIAATVPALMYLTDKGLLSLDGRLVDYLPGLKGSNKENLLIRDILSHQAGLEAWIPFYLKTLEEGRLSPRVYAPERSFEFSVQVAENLFIRKDYRDSILKMLIESKIHPKQGYKYSDLGYYFFQQIIEERCMCSLDEFVREKFYDKIGAHRLSYLPLRRFSPEEIVPTENDKLYRRQLLHGHVHDQGAAMLGGVAGHAGLFSNANDLAKLMQMYLQLGQYGGQSLIDSITVKEFTRCQFCDKDNRRGAGFDKPQLSGTGPTCGCLSMESYGHTGFTGTLAWVDPDTEIIYIFLSNRVHPDAENKRLLKLSTRTEIQQLIYDAIL